MVTLDVVLMALIAGTIIGFLTWSILTQYRHHACEHLRVTPRLQISVRWVPAEAREPAPRAQILL